MHLELDTVQMRAYMTLWRDIAAIRPGEIGVTDHAKRAKLLLRAAAMVAGWLDLLGMSQADEAELGQITSEIRNFQEWAAEAQDALKLLGQAGRTRS